MHHRPRVSAQDLTTLAEQFGASHRVYQQALLGELAQALDRPDALFVRNRLEEATTKLANDQYQHAVVTLHDYVGQMMVAGIEGTARALPKRKEPTLTDLVLEGLSELLMEIRTIVSQDQLRVRKAWQRFALEVELARPRLGSNAALFLRQGRLNAVRFRTSDRLGRQWDSVVFLTTMVRGHLLHVLVESFLYTLAQTGTDKAAAFKNDDSEPVVFSISGADPKLPAYLTLKESVFHPNAMTLVETVR